MLIVIEVNGRESQSNEWIISRTSSSEYEGGLWYLVRENYCIGFGDFEDGRNGYTTAANMEQFILFNTISNEHYKVLNVKLSTKLIVLCVTFLSYEL